MGARHRLRGPRHGGLEAEGAVHEEEVVVDGLGDAHDGHLEVPPLDLLGYGEGALLGAVPAYREEHVHVEALYRIDELLRALPASAGGAEDGAADLVDVVHDLGRQGAALEVVLGEEALVAIADAGDAAHAVAVPETAGDGAYHVVEAGAEASAGDDARMDVAGTEVDPLPRACLLEELRRREVGLMSRGRVGFAAHEIVVAHEARRRAALPVAEIDGGGDGGGAEDGDREIVRRTHEPEYSQPRGAAQ